MGATAPRHPIQTVPSNNNILFSIFYYYAAAVSSSSSSPLLQPFGVYFSISAGVGIRLFCPALSDGHGVFGGAHVAFQPCRLCPKCPSGGETRAARRVSDSDPGRR